MVSPLVAAADLWVVLFAFVTLVGDAGVLLAGLALLYWFGPRYSERARKIAAVCIGLAVVGLGVVVAIKTSTAVPRPTATPVDPTVLPPLIGGFVATEIDSSGFAFPSGHTVAATVVYGGLAVLLDRGRRRQRYLVAGGIIALVALSRLVLDVHYPRDVLAGVVVGALIVATGLWVARDVDRLRPDRLFWLAAVVALAAGWIALDVGQPRELTQAAIGFGTAVAGGVGWRQWGQRLSTAPAVSPLGAAGGLVGTGGLWGLAYTGGLSTVGTAIASGLAVSWLLLLPLLADRVKKIGVGRR